MGDKFFHPRNAEKNILAIYATGTCAGSFRYFVSLPRMVLKAYLTLPCALGPPDTGGIVEAEAELGEMFHVPLPKRG